MAPSIPSRPLLAAGLLALLAGCGEQPLDFDMRGLAGGFSTAEAALAAPARPRPDDRGIISYPSYQVVVAQRDDTPATIAARLGIDAAALAAHNGITPDTVLRRDEIIALPTRVAEPSPATGAPPAPVDVAGIAAAAIDRAGPVTTTPLAPAAPAAAPTATFPRATPSGPGGVEPIRHQVARGESAYSIARLYNIPVRTIADWNGLGPDLAVREGQQLMIPPATGPAPAAPVTAPGEGTATPVPPSAAEPLPAEVPPAAATAAAGTTATATPAPPAGTPDLGAEQTTPAPQGAMLMPVDGAIIRDYAPGRNEGIDIGAAAGTPVRAAAAGTVLLISEDSQGNQFMLIRHPDNLTTIYSRIQNLRVAKDDVVERGQVIAEVAAGATPSLQFQVARGTERIDPNPFLR